MAKVSKNLDRKLARLPGVKAEVVAVAERIAGTAKTRAAAHSDTGTYADSLHVVTGKVNAYVTSDDPHAASKEYGHTDKTTGRHVDGIHALLGAVADATGR